VEQNPDKLMAATNARFAQARIALLPSTAYGLLPRSVFLISANECQLVFLFLWLRPQAPLGHSGVVDAKPTVSG
jgi:hypothetical protein